MSKFIIIYPSDSTTDFLKGIPAFLHEHYKEFTETFRIDSSRESHAECIHMITQQSSKIFFIFLGHGASNYLAGARDSPNYDNFINETNLKIFESKKVFFLSCRSADFLKNKTFIRTSLGFGDLPSEYNEIETLQRISGLYDGITIETLELFKEILTEIIKYSLLDLIKDNLTFIDLFNRIKLRINKKMSEVLLKNKNEQTSKLTYMLYMMKDEMRIYGSENLTVFA
jgi:hypothetical protein